MSGSFVQSQDWAVEHVSKHVIYGTVIYTLTDYGRGETDWVRIFVVDREDGEILELTGAVANAADLKFQNDGKRFGIKVGGGQFNKGLEVFEWTCRVAGVAADQANWREL